MAILLVCMPSNIAEIIVMLPYLSKSHPLDLIVAPVVESNSSLTHELDIDALCYLPSALCNAVSTVPDRRGRNDRPAKGNLPPFGPKRLTTNDSW